jgi:hypothetical protein
MIGQQLIADKPQLLKASHHSKDIFISRILNHRKLQNCDKTRGIFTTVRAGALIPLFSQYFYLIRLLKTPHLIEFLDSSN